MRKSGESYINHPLAVAQIVADIGLDEVSVAAALLHDAVEDTEITTRRRRTGLRAPKSLRSSTVSPSSNGSASTVARSSKRPRCARCWWRWRRTCGCSSSSSPTVSTTCAPSPPCRSRSSSASRRRPSTSMPRSRIASACRRLKQQLEDLSFASLHPKRFAELDHLVRVRTPERDVYLAKTVAEVRARLERVEHRGRGHRSRQSTCGASTRRWS